MVVEARRLPLEIVARTASVVAASADLRSALAALAAAALEAADADLAVLRVLSEDGALVARAAAPETAALAGEVVGTRGSTDAAEAGRLADASKRAADRVRAAGVHVARARVGSQIVGVVELLRASSDFDDGERASADAIGAQLALALATLGDGRAIALSPRARWLELAGEALAAGGDSRRAAQQAVRVAAEATGAPAAALWRVGMHDELELAATVGELEGVLGRIRELAAVAVDARQPAELIGDALLGSELSPVLSLGLGEPPLAVLQIFFGESAPPTDAELRALGAFAARAAHAISAGDRSVQLELELARARSLLDVVGEAISRLSLAHTLETAVERVAELLQIDQLGVYLLDEGRLTAAAGRGLAFGHDDVAARLLELALGPLRARPAVVVDVGGDEPALATARAALDAVGQRAALAVPLHVAAEPIGLLVAYPGMRTLTESDAALLAALAAQLAVAVQNARLHERATALGATLTDVLASERQSTRRLSALYEISRSFTQSLSLDRTLEAVTSTIVEVLDVDAAVIRVPDDRGDEFVPRAVHVAETRLASAVHSILERPQPRPPHAWEPIMLDATTARRLGGAHALLIPFLEKGSTAALLPIAKQNELLAQLTIVSLDPSAPIGEETLTTAGTISQQAALALENARLYDQQKRFAETMQRSLLPRDRPSLPGLEVGAVYESAAQVDVGGDVFDFIELQDGRLAVVLGDVTGHGIDATADMAMAKFVFRSLAREHSSPGAFLRHANEVVVGEIAAGKFITMVCLVVDRAGAVRCASAGHPEPRLVLPDGTVEPLACGGLALGIEAGQEYEEASAALPEGASVVLYTDGVIEARSGRAMFGLERLDELLTERADWPAQELAQGAIDACRAFAGGELGDDCAIVVIRRRS